MSIERQNPDGSWSPIEPMPFIGWKARWEQKARQRGWKKVANFFAAWDEQGLGR